MRDVVGLWLEETRSERPTAFHAKKSSEVKQVWGMLNYTKRVAVFFLFLTTELLRAFNMLKTTHCVFPRQGFI